VTMPPDPFTQTGTKQGDDTMSAIIYCASLVVRGWADVVKTNEHRGAMSESGSPEEQERALVEYKNAMWIFQMGMAALERAFLIPPPGYRPPGG
jgi:hypothetical protein